jgi:hypothetical protein
LFDGLTAYEWTHDEHGEIAVWRDREYINELLTGPKADPNYS